MARLRITVRKKENKNSENSRISIVSKRNTSSKVRQIIRILEKNDNTNISRVCQRKKKALEFERDAESIPVYINVYTVISSL